MLFRPFIIFAALIPFLLSFVRDQRRFFAFGRPRLYSAKQHLARARKLAKVTARLGPTFIKLAQILGARSDLLPEVYVEQFATLHDRVPPVSAGAIKRVIRAELGRPVLDIFTSFDDVPIATASLGQVHSAQLDELRVAVKVIRPRVRKTVEQDLNIVRPILRFADYLFDHYITRSLVTLVHEFARIIEEEMDLRREARNADIFREQFADSEVLIIPEVFHGLTSRSVLVTRFHEGTKVTELEDQAPGHARVRTVIDQLIEIYAQQILVNGFFHADPHPGNILVRDDGRIVLLDFGMVIRVDDKTRQRLLRTTIAWARRDVDALIESLYELGVIEPESNFAVVSEVAAELIEIIDRHRYTQQKIREVCNDVLNTFYRFPLRMPSNIVYLFKTAVLIEGLGVKFDPTFDGAKAATPVIKRLMGNVLPDIGQTLAEQIKDRLRELLRTARDGQRLITKAAREELRVRAHEHDLRRFESLIGAVTRRIIIGLFVLSLPVIVGIIYHKMGNIWLLAAAVALTSVAMIPIIMLPIRMSRRNQGKR